MFQYRFEDIKVHLVHQHMTYFLLPHYEHPMKSMNRPFARPSLMVQNQPLLDASSVHSETSQTKQLVPVEFDLPLIWKSLATWYG